ncbi:hypothetical protein GGR56DRAFT_698174 [Xylariaceae sp. FL0804]|nr:hypothetical protein GGR56DRAFT_698174 [Xylariaceae sp. FL0804]
MSSLFCCGSVKPYKSQYVLHQAKFTTFMDWAKSPKNVVPVSSPAAEHNDRETPLESLGAQFVIQLVRQVNYGPLEGIRYFARVDDSKDIGDDEKFVEVKDKDLIQANFKKLNSYKNFRCAEHDKFFELNVYEKDPVNKHHWRNNLERPATSIDL